MSLQKKSGQKIALVCLAAGMSSRFGGKLKQFAPVGPKGEAFVEMIIQEALPAGFDEIVFIVGEKTEGAFKEKFGANYCGTPVLYTKQTFDPAERDRPWGTVDALATLKGIVNGPFVVCNGDDMYGEEAFKLAHDFLKQNQKENENIAIGYELEKVLPEEGKTNRGIFITNENGDVSGVVEAFDVEKGKLKERGLTLKTLASMNFYGLKEKTLDLLSQKLSEFKENHEGDRKAECILPIVIGELVKEKELTVKLVPTKGRFLGITNPADEETVRRALAKNADETVHTIRKAH